MKIYKGYYMRKHKRLIIIVIVSLIFFKWFCIPMHIDGISMAPTFNDGSVGFAWRGLKPLYQPKPERGDLCLVKFSSRNVFLLKRVIAFAGETVEFKDGQLFVNDQPLDEPYTTGKSKWNLSKRTVKPDHIYVIGDNRDVAINNHTFGNAKQKNVRSVELFLLY